MTLKELLTAQVCTLYVLKKEMGEQMDFGEAIKTCFQKYFDFSGRASRHEFWWFTLFTNLASILISIVELTIGMPVAVFSGIFLLAIIMPSLAVSWRRLSDFGVNGMWNLPIYALFFIGLLMLYSAPSTAILILLIGLIWGVTLYVQPGDVDRNKYGPSPLR